MVALAAAVAIPAVSPAAALDGEVARDLDFAQQQMRATADSVPQGKYPYYTGRGGDWVTTGPRTWVAGLFPGALWQLYGATGDPYWRTQAEARQAPLGKRTRDRSTHDLGFIVFNSFGNGYRFTRSDADRRVLLRAADSLATRFDAAVGAIRSRRAPARRRRTVIIDNLVNLELLFWAAKHGGDPAWYGAALSSARRTLRDHVRPDGSTRQAVRYDWHTGRITGRPPLQALGKHSVWARGQAWGIYGLAMAYRESRDPALLGGARSAADWFISHIPPDRIPFWDFSVAERPHEPRDSSAAAIAASGLYQLAAVDPDGARAAGYRRAADSILAALSSASYLAEGRRTDSILLHGTQDGRKGNVDTGLIHGDYYFVEALLRHLSPPEPDSPTTRITALEGNAGVRKGLRRGVRVKVWGSEPGRIRVALIPRRKTARALGRHGRHLDVVGRGHAELAERGWTSIRVPFSRRARRHLRGRTRAKLLLSAVLEGSDGGGDATAASVKLSRR
jgi:hypothetical protein